MFGYSYRPTAPRIEKKIKLRKETVFDGESLTGWTVSGGTVEIDNAIFRTGTGSAKFTTPATAYQGAYIEKAVDWHMLNKALRLIIYFDPVNPPPEVRIHLYSGGTKNAMYRISRTGMCPEYWWHVATNRSDWRFLEGFTKKDFANITKLRVGFVTWDTVARTAYIDNIGLFDIIPTQSGILTFRFDDGSSTDCTIAKKHMDKYGFKGTSFIITGAVESEGYMTLAQLHEMYDAGWDIGSHTKNHVHLGQIGLEAVRTELTDSKAYLEANGFTRSSNLFVAPFSNVNAMVMNEIKQRYVCCGVGGQWSVNKTYNITGGVASLSFPPVNFFETGVNQLPYNSELSLIQTVLNDVKQHGEWVIPITHAITDEAAWATFVKAVHDSGIDVMTFSEVYDLLYANRLLSN